MKTIFTLFASLLITISALAYDQSRLSISTVTDKRNYYIVNEVLAFNNSKDELARFIRNF